MDQHQTTPLHAGTLQRLLSDRAFFRDQQRDIFRLAENRAHEVTAQHQAPILREGDSSPFSWFLVEGSVTLKREGHPDRVISAADADAQYPLANLRPCRYTVVPELKSRLVRLEQAFLKQSQGEAKPARFTTDQQGGGGSWQSHPFAIEIIQLARQGSLDIPALPGISVKISEAMNEPKFNLTDLARIISADPAIAGRLMSVANSALFAGQSACQSLHAAIVRLGVEQTRTLVTSLASKALFSVQQKWLHTVMQNNWRHAVDMACYSTVLARLADHFDHSRALLMGLLHEIGGVAIAQQASRYPELEQTPGVLQAVLSNLGPELSTQTLLDWGLAEFAEAAENQENWRFGHSGAPSFTDLLIVAHVHHAIKEKRHQDLPRFQDIPAFQRLAALGLSADTGVTLLEESRQEMSELRALLR